MPRPARHPKLPPVAPIALAGAAACAVAGAWALWQIGQSPVPSAEQVLASLRPQAVGSAHPESMAARFDLAAFHTPIWIAQVPEPQPEPAQAQPRPAPPPALRATLLAIAQDATHALVHDQEADRILTLRVGDAFQGRMITRIEPGRVTLLIAGQAQALDLGYAVGSAARSREAAP